MRLNRVVGLVLVLGLLACTGMSASAQEMRGGWVTAWVDGFFTPQQVDATVAAAKAAGLNALFIQVRKNADAYYTSATEPRGDGMQDGFDPLAYAIEKAHAQGIQVHAWMNSGRVWSPKTPPSDPKHIANRHPEWLNRNYKGETRASEGLYLDLGIPEAREYVASVAEEIARKYDIDGIHLDYIRYPGNQWGYSPLALGRYFREANTTTTPKPTDPKWLQWKRDQITAFAKLVCRKVLAAKPGVLISASTIPWGDCNGDWTSTSPYAQVCQDWRRWMEEGIIDANCPMNYKVEQNARNAKQFRNWLAGFKQWRYGGKVFVGVDFEHNSPADIVQQIEAIRKNGLDGFIIFPFNKSSRRDALVKALKEGPCKASEFASAREAYDRGIRYAVKQEFGMAESCLQQATEIDPNYTEAYYRLGRCYLREKNYAKAVELFEKTLSLRPSYAGVKKDLQAAQKLLATQPDTVQGTDSSLPK